VASVTFAETLPWIVVSLPSEVLIDRHDRRWIMQLAAAGRVLLMVLLIAALLFHLVSIGLLIGLGFLLGCADVFGSNSANGLVRNLVASTQMERANGVVGAIDFVGGSFIGPALGNVLFAIVAFLPFGADAAAVLIAIALLASVPGNFRAAPTNSVDAGMWREIVVGAAWLWRHRALRILALLAEASNLGFGMVQGILVLFVLEIMHLPRAAYGSLLAALAVGGLLGPCSVAASGPAGAPPRSCW
jgi:MFS family permease